MREGEGEEEGRWGGAGGMRVSTGGGGKEGEGNKVEKG